MLSINRSLKQRLLACAIAGSVSFVSPDFASAADCGCQASCQTCQPVKRCSCNCDCSPGLGRNLSQAMDVVAHGVAGVAGGVEKLLTFKLLRKDCDELLCDDACDAMMIEELMVPDPPAHHHGHHHGHHHHNGHNGRRHEAPHQPMVQPDVQSENNSHLPEPAQRVPPPPVRMPAPGTQRQPLNDPNRNGGSLFDTLQDPFSDDEANLQPLRMVQPANYSRPIAGSRSSTPPLSRSHQTSSRRVAKSVR